MLETIKPEKIKTYKEWTHEFRYLREDGSLEGAGFSFSCDEHGNLLNPNPDKLDNYRQCLTGRTVHGPVRDLGIQERTVTVRIPRVCRCECGAELEMVNRFTITCHRCGADYNSAGQRLSPRSQWGEETGEPWYECY